MGGEFNTDLQIAGHFSRDFNTVPEVRFLRWTGTKSLQHVKEKEKQQSKAEQHHNFLLNSGRWSENCMNDECFNL